MPLIGRTSINDIRQLLEKYRIISLSEVNNLETDSEHPKPNYDEVNIAPFYEKNNFIDQHFRCSA